MLSIQRVSRRDLLEGFSETRLYIFCLDNETVRFGYLRLSLWFRSFDLGFREAKHCLMQTNILNVNRSARPKERSKSILCTSPFSLEQADRLREAHACMHTKRTARIMLPSARLLSTKTAGRSGKTLLSYHVRSMAVI